MYHLDPDYSHETPLVKILFMKRDLDGNIQPLQIRHINIYRKESSWSRQITADGIGVVLPIKDVDNSPDTFTLTRSLAFGHTYNISSFIRFGANEPFLPLGTKPVFAIPTKVEKGHVLQIPLIIEDEIREQAFTRDKKLALQTQKLTLSLESYPRYSSTDWKFVAVYRDNSGEYEGIDKKERGIIQLDVKSLGGELVVYGIPPKSAPRLWFYMKKVVDNKLILPQDADMVTAADLLQVYLKVTDKARIQHLEGMGLFFSSDSQLPLFFGKVRADGGKQILDRIPLAVAPGDYYLRGILPGSSEYPLLGQVRITSEAEAIYTVDLSRETKVK